MDKINFKPRFWVYKPAKFFTASPTMKEEFDFKKLIELLPLIPAWALIYSSINEYVYYISFGLNIFKYIDIGELLIISIPSFALTVLSILILSYISNLIPLDDDKITYDDVKTKKDLKTSKIIFTVSIVAQIIIFIADYFIRFNDFFNLLKIVVYCFTIVAFFWNMNFLYAYIKKGKQKKFFIAIGLQIYASILISMFLGSLKYDYLKLNHIGSSIIFNNTTIKSSEHYYYIGHTKAYMFFQNDSLNTVDVYPASLISRMTLK